MFHTWVFGMLESVSGIVRTSLPRPKLIEPGDCLVRIKALDARPLRTHFVYDVAKGHVGRDEYAV